MTLSIGGVEIGGNNPCRFVAEISNNHNGSLMRAGKLIEAAKNVGADLVKFQCYTPAELVALRGDGPAPEPWGSQGWTMLSLYQKAATPLPWFEYLARYCESFGIPWFSSVFGAESLALLESLNCPAYKIARLDNGQRDLVNAVIATGKPVIISEAEPGESGRIDHRPDTVQSESTWLRLYCPPGYPQSRFNFADRFTPGLCPHFAYDCHGQPPRFDGFSYHGTDPAPCVVAATLGAKVIEAHFQLDDEPSELEANVSLAASQFRRMVNDARRTEEIIA